MMRTKHAVLLNNLVDMQASVAYAARRSVLQEAECVICQQEAELAQRDELIARLKKSTWNENVQFLAEAKENLLQQYVNLTQYYGEQKHEIRSLRSELSKKDEEIVRCKNIARQFERDWLEVCDQVLNLQADLDRVTGLAVYFATACDADAIITSEIVEAAQRFLATPEAQSWRARQGMRRDDAPMVWTTEPPNEPGWYWWKCAPDAPPKCEQVKRIEGLGLSWYGGRVWLKVDIKGGEWWPERIKEPKS